MESSAYTPKYLDLIYDVGMHKGEDTDFYLRKGFRVVAFEADPDLTAYCRERFKASLKSGQLTIVEGAIVNPDLIQANRPTVPFYKNNDHSVWGTVSPEWAARNARLGTSSTVIQVDSVNFEDAIRKHGIPYFIKIDVEGCDQVCLESLKCFDDRPTYVSIESDKKSFRNVIRELEALSALGYNSFKAVEQSQVSHRQSAPYPAREGEYVNHRFAAESSGLFGKELQGAWKSWNAILGQFRLIHLSYRLVGEDGIITKCNFLGADFLRRVTGRVLRLFTRAVVPGWYDTHACYIAPDPAERYAFAATRYDGGPSTAHRRRSEA
jgi:FkbM family methyltransferase